MALFARLGIVDRGVIEDLVREHSTERCLTQLDAWAARPEARDPGVRNPAGLLISFIRTNKPLPEGYVPAPERDRRREQARAEEARRALEQERRARTAAGVRAAYEALAPPEREALDREAWARVPPFHRIRKGPGSQAMVQAARLDLLAERLGLRVLRDGPEVWYEAPDPTSRELPAPTGRVSPDP